MLKALLKFAPRRNFCLGRFQKFQRQPKPRQESQTDSQKKYSSKMILSQAYTKYLVKCMGRYKYLYGKRATSICELFKQHNLKQMYLKKLKQIRRKQKKQGNDRKQSTQPPFEKIKFIKFSISSPQILLLMLGLATITSFIQYILFPEFDQIENLQLPSTQGLSYIVVRCYKSNIFIQLYYKSKETRILNCQKNMQKIEKVLGTVPDDVPITFKYQENKLLPNGTQYLIIMFSMILLYFFTKKKIKKTPTISLQNRNYKNKPIDPKNIKETFASVAGMQQAKVQIKEFVQFLKDPEKFIKLGARMPRGALLYGPPGTGKTLLGKACAKEAKVPFFYTSGSDFVEMFVGVGASRVRQLFNKAKASAPAIIFIDELDAIGKKRGKDVFNQQRQTTLNQLLIEMDGFATENRIVIIAATNRKEILDPALLRPGRFDRLIQIGLPTRDDRQKIMKIYLRRLKFKRMNSAISSFSKQISNITAGFAGADLENVCNEAAIIAARNNQHFIQKKDLHAAVQRVSSGLQKKNQNLKQAREIMAQHHAGTVLVAWLNQYAPHVIKASLARRSKHSLGFVHLQKSEIRIRTKSDLIARLSILVGGKVAQKVILGRESTLPEEKLQEIREVAEELISVLGMDDELSILSIDKDQRRPSDWLMKQIEQRSMQLVRQTEQQVTKLLQQNRPKLDQISQALLQKETLDRKEITRILGPKQKMDLSKCKVYQKA